MRAFLILALLAVCFAGLSSGQTYVNSATKNCTSVNSCAVTYSPTSGNLVLAKVFLYSYTGTVSAADNATGGSSTYSISYGPLNASGGGNVLLEEFYSLSVKSGASSITISTTGSFSGVSIVVEEYSGGTWSLDVVVSSATFNTTNPAFLNANSITPTSGKKEVIGGMCWNFNSTYASSGSWTLRNSIVDSASGNYLGGSSQIVSSTSGSYTMDIGVNSFVSAWGCTASSYIVAVSVAHVVNVSENLRTADSATRTFGAARSRSELLSTVDSGSRVLGAARPVSELLSIKELTSRNVGAARTISESLSIMDVGSRGLAFSRSASETLAPLDIASRSSIFARAAVEILGKGGAIGETVTLTGNSSGHYGASATWDVSNSVSGNSNTNGGGFDSSVSAPGTDESHGAGTAVTLTMLSGNTATCTPACTATTHGPGNFIHVTASAGCVAGWAEEQSQTGGVITLDHSIGFAVTPPTCTGQLGGSMTDLITPWSTVPAANGNSIYVQSGTWTYSSTQSENSGYTGKLQLFGYQTSHGDFASGVQANCPLIKTATNSTNLFSLNAEMGFLTIRCFNFSNTAVTPAVAFNPVTNFGATAYLVMSDVTFSGFTVTLQSGGLGHWNSLILDRVEMKNCSGSGNICLPMTGSHILIAHGLYMHNNAGTSLNLSGGSSAIYDSVFADNTGADIVSTDNLGLFGDAFARGSGDAVDVTTSLATVSGTMIINSIFYGKAGYAFNTGGNDYPGYRNFNTCNAFGNNTLGDFNGITGYGRGDISGLASSPWTSTTNFALVSGSSLIGAGCYGSTPFGTGHRDIGPLQSAGSGGSGTVSFPF